MKKLFIACAVFLFCAPAQSFADSAEGRDGLCYGVQSGGFFWSQKARSCDDMVGNALFKERFSSDYQVQTDAGTHCVLMIPDGLNELLVCHLNQSRAQIKDIIRNTPVLLANKNVRKIYGLDAETFGAADWKAEAEAMEDSAAGR
jgi:hypothetical protein